MKFISHLSKERLICNELHIKHYKNIIKSCYGETIDSHVFIENLCEVFVQLTNKPIEFFKRLNILDLFCLLLDIRINSQGSSCSLSLTRNEKKVNLDLNLNHVREELKTLYDDLTVVINVNSVEVLFECPGIDRLLQDSTADYIPYIKQSIVMTNNEAKQLVIPDNSTAEWLFDSMPPKVSLEIIRQFSVFVERVTGVNFLSRYGIKDQSLSFIPSIESLIWFTKLLFNEPLESLYENIFALAYAGKMTPQYIEECAIGEYIFFSNCLRKTQNSNNSKTEEDFVDPSLADNLEEGLGNL